MPWGPETRPSIGAITARALLYAICIVLLVVFAPGTEHVFIYQGF
jgi:hypothetical protein